MAGRYIAKSSRIAKCNPSVDFALKATSELNEAAKIASKQLGGANPFLTTLSPLLTEVENRLDTCLKSDSMSSEEMMSEERLLKLIGVLERLAKWPAPLKELPTSPFRRRNYPHLDSLVRRSNNSQQATRDGIKKLANSHRDSASRQRGNFQTSFTNFAKSKNRERGPPLSDVISLGVHPAKDEDHSSYLRLLHAVLRRMSVQVGGCCGDFKANIALTQVRRMEHEEKDIVPFNLFFLHRHPPHGCMWKETRIRVLLASGASRTVKTQFSNGQKISPEDFCGIVRRRAYGRMILNAADDDLYFVQQHMNVERLERLFLLEASSVSLATILETRKLDGDDQVKLLLSYLLAKAVWQFYDSEWMTHDWTKRTIHFMRERVSGMPRVHEILTLLHKPFFAAELRPLASVESSTAQEPDPLEQRFPSTTHLFPKILALGIMLLEIELGEGIERHRPDESLDQTVENVDHYTAGGIISSEMWRRRKTYQAVKDIIEICLRPDVGKLGLDNQGVRGNLYVYVVAPLGKLFKQAWSRDQEPEDFNPNPICFRPTDIPTDEIGLLSHEGANHDDQHTSLSSQQPISGAASPTTAFNLESKMNAIDSDISFGLSDTEDGELAGDDGVQNEVEARRKGADGWFSNFQKLLVTHQLLGKGNDLRLKVAILDSGIDINHPDFSAEDRSRMVEIKSFTGGEPTDTAGHGTHIATVVLRLTKNVDLYIAKITHSSKVKQRDVVADAIRHARTDWKVDIINLSFGFETVSYSDNMSSEIRECIHDNIIVIASASNDGGEGTRTYPAKLPNVICAHAATFHGRESSFNPPPEGPYSLSFVGEEIRPVWRWPSKAPKHSGLMAYKSGTSYAAPVAVAVAAFMIGYIEKKLPGYNWRITPKSPEGITKIFQLMMTRIDNYDWVSPTRYFRHTIEDKIYGDLKQELG